MNLKSHNPGLSVRNIAFVMGFLAALPIGSHAIAASRDGAWTAVLTTQAGKCEKAFQMRFAARGGDLVTATGSGQSADGAIEPDGTLWLRMKSSRDLYRLQGRMRGASANGTWSSNTRLCGGTWRGSRGK